MAKHNEVGVIGEGIACKWLEDSGFDILQRNYRKKYGEIDIVIRETGNRLHFIEVKTVSYETKEVLEYAMLHETWRPEENVHHEKQKRIARTIESWLLENQSTDPFQIDIITVRLVPREKFASIRLIENLIFE